MMGPYSQQIKVKNMSRNSIKKNNKTADDDFMSMWSLLSRNASARLHAWVVDMPIWDVVDDASERYAYAINVCSRACGI